MGLGHGLLPVSGGSATGLAWHRTEPVMGHIQHLFFESLVKMDHFQKEPPLNLKGTTWAKGSEIPRFTPPKADIGRWPDRRLNSSGVNFARAGIHKNFARGVLKIKKISLDQNDRRP